MEQKQPDMMDLEQFMASTESDAKEDEQLCADSNFHFLDSELAYTKKSIPYPDTQRYSVSSDYSEISELSYEKRVNKPYFDKIKALSEYCDSDSLYEGHVRINNNDFFIMDDSLLESMSLDNDSVLVNSDDEHYSYIVSTWRGFEKSLSAEFSRNIVLSGRDVDNVEIVFDKGFSAFSDITDNYLRKALLRNRNKPGIGSIIQTIQRKQNNIRSLPKSNSFIVQGCAGSGKTMILLHRLRYLIYNKYIFPDEYILLVPSNEFKSFIERLAINFNIHKDNIIPYKEYYQLCCKTKTPLDHTDTNELVFPTDYLETIYSKDFIKRIYQKLFDSFSEQIDSLIELCEKRLKEIDFSEHFAIEQEIEALENSAIKTAKNIIGPLGNFISSAAITNLDDIPSVLKRLVALYKDKKDKYDSAISRYEEIVISPDDKRLAENYTLLQLSEKISNEEEAIKKASVFTVIAHRNKLKHLKADFEKEKNAIVNSLIAEEKQKQEKEAEALSFVCNGVNISSMQQMISDLDLTYSTTTAKIKNTRKKLENINDYISDKYSEEITALNDIIDYSADFPSIAENLIDELSPCYTSLFDKMKNGKEMLDGLFKGSSQNDTEYIKNNLAFFSQESDNKIYNAINMALLNICKKEIRSSFNIEICNHYKHYWYLSLYCKYLTRPVKTDRKHYIFIDEAQDLNISEIELIEKLNTTKANNNSPNHYDKPVLNLFGDVKQTITSHGISNWQILSDLVPTIYELNENFRNTNQIIEYCNKALSLAMESVGIDLDEVTQYQDIDSALNDSPSISDNPIFIVKDEYSLSDLDELLEKNEITAYQSYTVKSVKGLEFNEIFVFDSGMTNNEKYISYTRALSKLNIIHSLPTVSDRNNELFIRGSESGIDEYIE